MERPKCQIENCNNLATRKGTTKKGKKRFGKFCSTHYKKKYNIKSVGGNRYINKISRMPCQICGWKESRCDKHRIIPGSQGGKYNKSNAIALCPNCHRVIHDKMKINPTETINFLAGILKNTLFKTSPNSQLPIDPTEIKK